MACLACPSLAIRELLALLEPGRTESNSPSLPGLKPLQALGIQRRNPSSGEGELVQQK